MVVTTTVCGTLITLTGHLHQRHDYRIFEAFGPTSFGTSPVTSFPALFAPCVTSLCSSNLIQLLRDKGQRRYVLPPAPWIMEQQPTWHVDLVIRHVLKQVQESRA